MHVSTHLRTGRAGLKDSTALLDSTEVKYQAMKKARKQQKCRFEKNCLTWQGFVVLMGVYCLIPLREGKASSSTRPFTTGAGHCSCAGGSVVLLVPSGHPPPLQQGTDRTCFNPPSVSKILPDAFRLGQVEPLTSSSARLQPSRSLCPAFALLPGKR